MASPFKTVILTLFILPTIILASSCVKVRGPGIMPFIEEDAFGEWIVLTENYSPARSGSDEGSYQWNITLQYLAGEGDHRITAPDIRVFFDGDQLPFTFNEADQILETGISAAFGSSLKHLLIIKPAEGCKFSFSSFNLAFD